MGMQREATEHFGTEAYGKSPEGADKGIVLWEITRGRCCVQFSYRRIESTKYYAVLVDKEAVAGAISAGGDIAMLYEHGGKQGRLRGR